MASTRLSIVLLSMSNSKATLGSFSISPPNPAMFLSNARLHRSLKLLVGFLLLRFALPLPIVFSFVWVAPDFSNITLYDMLRYLSITTLFRVRQASHFPDEFLLIPALFTTSSVLLFVVCVNAALGSHIELLANCVMVGCSDMMSGSACSL